MKRIDPVHHQNALVTVGLPVFNNERTISTAIASVLGQTYTNFELIIVDDGSIDQSLSVASSFEDSRIRVITDGVNKGLAYRLNQISELGKGNLLARMDADDIMHPFRLETQVMRLLCDDLPDLVGSNMWVIDSEGSLVGKRFSTAFQPRIDDVLRGQAIAHPTIMGRVEWFRRNPYDSSLRRTEDLELWARTFSHTRYRAIDEPLLFYRESPHVRIETYRIAMREQRLIIRRYGPAALGWKQTLLEIGRSIAKEGVAIGLSRTRLQEEIVRRRYIPLTVEERHHAGTVLASIQESQLGVPGHSATHGDFFE